MEIQEQAEDLAHRSAAEHPTGSDLYRSVSLRAGDGVRLSLNHIKPSDENGGAVLITPAMGAPARAYRRLGRALAARGHAVGILDPRGNGQSDQIPSHAVNFGVKEFLEQDWPAAVGWLRHAYPSRKLILMGHSFGGQLNSAYAGNHPEEIDALINLCAVWIHFRELGSLHHQLGGLFFYILMRVSAEILGYGPGDKLGWGSRFAKQHIRDWSSWGIVGRYTYRGGDMRACLRCVHQPVLAVSFSDDTALGPKKACDRFCREMSAAPITRWHLRPEEISKTKVGHFGALKSADAFWAKLDGWIRETVAAG